MTPRYDEVNHVRRPILLSCYPLSMSEIGRNIRAVKGDIAVKYSSTETLTLLVSISEFIRRSILLVSDKNTLT